MPHSVQRRKSVNDVPIGLSLTEASLVRKASLDSLRQNHRRRSEQIQLLLSREEEIVPQNRRFSVPNMHVTEYGPNEGIQSSTTAVPNMEVGPSSSKTDGDNMQQDDKKSVNYLREMIKQRRQRRLSLVISLTNKGIKRKGDANKAEEKKEEDGDDDRRIMG